MIKTIETVFGNKDIEMVDSPKFGEIPKTVYKFRNWEVENHKELLNKGEIYLSAPKELNDPFDCGIDIAYHTLMDNPELELAFWRKTIKNVSGHLTEEAIEDLVQKMILEGNCRNPDF